MSNNIFNSSYVKLDLPCTLNRTEALRGVIRSGCVTSQCTNKSPVVVITKFLDELYEFASAVFTCFFIIHVAYLLGGMCQSITGGGRTSTAAHVKLEDMPETTHFVTVFTDRLSMSTTRGRTLKEIKHRGISKCGMGRYNLVP